MSAQQQTHYISEAEYEELEAVATIKHEYFNGEVFAMSGGSREHSEVSANAIGSLVGRLRGKPCRVGTSDQKIKIEATGLHTYPDVVAYCSGARFEGKSGDITLLDPKVILEVLSPGTQDYDRTTKFEHYKRIATLTDYLLVSQDHVWVEHYARHENGWLRRDFTSRDESVSLSFIDAELPLDELYDGLNLPSGLRPLGKRDDSNDF